ncbi:MAG: SpoIID/LytB domain-containing protein [Ruminococcus sp.]|jgi:stage II sporulation protein D|nr:SpoIID/LytB domain-containing protein [Ruminococcus sp.]
MKRMLRLGFVILGIMVIIPVFAIVFFREYLPPAGSDFAQSAAVNLDPPEKIAAPEIAYTAPPVVRLKSGEIIPMRDYVIGSVFAEMNADFPPEALKAEALAVFTCIVRETVKHRNDSFDIADDFYIGYFTEGLARAFYTDGYETAYAKISTAVDEIMGSVIVFEDEPIAAPSFDCFTGKTEAAADVPYLTSVPSSGDVYSPFYQTSESFTAAEISARLSTEAGITLGGDPTDYFEIIDITPAGTILTLRAGNSVISGEMFTEILNLRSPAFVIHYDNNTERIVITSIGNGDGIGLSKYGAKFMAENGSDYKEIILHYFHGVRIDKILIEY